MSIPVRIIAAWLGFAAWAAVPLAAQAACPSDIAIEAFVNDYLAKRPAQAMRLESLDDAFCAQDKVVAGLTPHFGAVIGWKIGLTAKPVQAMFGATEPVRGRIFARTILPDGSTIPVRFGAVPVWEADLLATVKSADINKATTPEAIAAALSSITPFIELADLALAKDEPLNAMTITAINVGARFGIGGKPIAANDPAALAAALASMQVVARDDTGQEISRAPGAAILGHPLNALAWLVKSLQASGLALKPGDIISLGAFSRPLQPIAGRTVTVRYDGLPGTPSVQLQFRD